MARKGYPPEFRRRIVELVEGGRKVAEVAVEFDVGQQAVGPACGRLLALRAQPSVSNVCASRVRAGMSMP
jgi:hypothetical protein